MKTVLAVVVLLSFEGGLAAETPDLRGTWRMDVANSTTNWASRLRGGPVNLVVETLVLSDFGAYLRTTESMTLVVSKSDSQLVYKIGGSVRVFADKPTQLDKEIRCTTDGKPCHQIDGFTPDSGWAVSSSWKGDHLSVRIFREQKGKLVFDRNEDWSISADRTTLTITSTTLYPKDKAKLNEQRIFHNPAVDKVRVVDANTAQRDGADQAGATDLCSRLAGLKKDMEFDAVANVLGNHLSALGTIRVLVNQSGAVSRTSTGVIAAVPYQDPKEGYWLTFENGALKSWSDMRCHKIDPSFVRQP